jgi:prepilin-type N-terminal cleavage/methylation domain-containing protein/prepilin-type processing-associated H-X9-DG protein
MQRRVKDTLDRPALSTLRRGGFTLIECLVVVAVIVILVALLIPVIKKARWQAQMANCVSNQRQILLVAQTYHALHQWFPPSLGWGGAVSGNLDYSWANIYNYHSKDDGIPGRWLYGKQNRWLVTYFGKLMNDPKVLTCPAGPDSAKLLQDWYLNPPTHTTGSGGHITQGSYYLFWGGYYQRGFDAVNGDLIHYRGPKRLSDTKAGRMLVMDATMGIRYEWRSPHRMGTPSREVQVGAFSAQLTTAGLWSQPRPQSGGRYEKVLPDGDMQVNVGFVDGSVQSIHHRDLRGMSFGNNLFDTASYYPLSELKLATPVTLP